MSSLLWFLAISELAQKAGVTKRYVDYLAKGQQVAIGYEYVSKLLEALGMTLEIRKMGNQKRK